VLLQTFLAAIANATRVHHAAYGYDVALFELLDGTADLGYAANNFVARDAGINRRHKVDPLIPRLVQIGVADTTKQDFDLNIVFLRATALNGVRP
jgi:hypothetical protein